MTVSTPSTLLTVNECAARLRCSIALIYKLTKSGALPCLRVGSSIRIDSTDLADYLARTDGDAA